ncbi:MAG: ABC transporter substrate-binding protein [Polaromonas sp.]|nr:ABC transporter substrate-binding protein [Polaromonas sp.]
MFTKLKIMTFIAACLLMGSANAQEELKIGGIGPLSGGGTAWGIALQRGTQMAIDEANASGGLKVGGKAYAPKLVMFDDQYTSAGGRLAADRLVNIEKVKFIVGPIGSPSVLGALSVTNPAGVIMLSNGFANAILKNDSKSPYNFRAMDSTVEFAPAMIKWYRKNHPETKKVALIAPNDAVGQSVVPMLEAYYKENGFTVWKELYDRGSKEFTPLLTRMMAQNVDLLDLNSNAPGESALLVKQARQAGFKPPIWQVGGPSVDEVIDIAGPLSEGFTSLNVFDFSQPGAKAFLKTYRDKYGNSVLNAQTPVWYNATRLLFEAMRRAGSTTDVTKVRDALEKLDGYDAGLFGPTKWGGMGDYGVSHQLLLKFWIVEVKNGKQITRAVVQPEQR